MEGKMTMQTGGGGGVLLHFLPFHSSVHVKIIIYLDTAAYELYFRHLCN